MNKIFGDEFKDEIRNLKKLERKLADCKIGIEEVIHVIDNKDVLIKTKPSLMQALKAVISLSNTVESLLGNIKSFEKAYSNMSSWVKAKVAKKAEFVAEVKNIRRVRVGAEKLIKEYNYILKKLGVKYREEILKRD
tara:strand:+ start:420 stop:827 length:408 start_codon:yes stop_codon:yes gene_type:complete